MRPLPVILIGYYQILRGLVIGLFGLSVLAFAGLAAKLTSLVAEGNAVQQFLRTSGHIAGLIFLVFAVLTIAAGYGLLHMQNWGRLLTLLFSAIGVAVLLPFLHWVLPMILAFINGAVIIYLVLPTTKRAFHGPSQGSSVRAAA